MSTGTKVVVTAEDIECGFVGDCYYCPVALALGRAMGDGEAHVFGRDWNLWLMVHGRVVSAPPEVNNFVTQFDSQPRTDDNHLDSDDPDCEPPAPFEFWLPPDDSPEWQEECSGCQSIFYPSELDEDGECEECRKITET